MQNFHSACHVSVVYIALAGALGSFVTRSIAFKLLVTGGLLMIALLLHTMYSQKYCYLFLGGLFVQAATPYD